MEKRDSVLAQWETASAEKILNLLAENKIRFSGAHRTGTGLRMWLPAADVHRARAITEEEGNFRILRRAGTQVLREKLLRRKYAIAAGIVCLLIFGFSTLFVWNIRVEGCDCVTASRVLRALERENIRVGSFRLVNQPDNLENRLLLSLPSLGRISVNPKGTTLTVQVREKRKTPEFQSAEPMDVSAARDGIIVRITALEGQTAVSVGNAVTKGDTLIASGWESLNSGTRYVSAMGEVLARTKRSVTAKVTLLADKVTADSEARTYRSVVFGTKRMNFYFCSRNPGAYCDKITEKITPTLPGGVTLPVYAVRETVVPLSTVRETCKEDPVTVTKRMLLARLESSLPAGGEVLEAVYAVEKTEKLLTVTLEAECLEDIAVRHPAENSMEPKENIS